LRRDCGQLEPAVVQGGRRGKSASVRIVDFGAAQTVVPVTFVGTAGNQNSSIGKQAGCVLVPSYEQATGLGEFLLLGILELGHCSGVFPASAHDQDVAVGQQRRGVRNALVMHGTDSFEFERIGVE
jgi:hypothetical protein